MKLRVQNQIKLTISGRLVFLKKKKKMPETSLAIVSLCPQYVGMTREILRYHSRKSLLSTRNSFSKALLENVVSAKKNPYERGGHVTSKLQYTEKCIHTYERTCSGVVLNATTYSHQIG